MTGSFYQVQESHGRRLLPLLVLLGAVYTLALALVLLGLRVTLILIDFTLRPDQVFLPTGPHVVVSTVSTSFLLALALGVPLVIVQYYLTRTKAVRILTRDLGVVTPDIADRFHQRFENIVEEMRIAAGYGRRIQAVILPSFAVTAFAAEDEKDGALIGATEGLVSRLRRDQIQAAVAHELGHVCSGDARLHAISCAMLSPFSRMAGFWRRLLEGVSPDICEKEEPVFGAPHLMVLFFLNWTISQTCLLMVRLVSTTLSRGCELAADARAVELTRNPLALAEALHEAGRRHHFLNATALPYAPIFILDPTGSALSGRGEWYADLFASHPPLSQRIDILLDMAHTDRSHLRVPASVEEVPQASLVPSDQPEIAERWLFRKKGQWIGPLQLDDLLVQPDFGPEMWLMAEPDGRPVQAGSVAFIMDSLRKIKGGQSALAENRIAALPLPGARAENRDMCPACQEFLVSEDYEGSMLDMCPSCGGVLVEEHKVMRILQRRERAIAESMRRKARDMARVPVTRSRLQLAAGPETAFPPPDCPRCGQKMYRRLYTYLYPVVIDQCPACLQIWFDPGELDILQAMVEARDRD
ncbi:M48 family metalloprotease [bacterium]|nr:M48 family metalloprotease [bacterium]